MLRSRAEGDDEQFYSIALQIAAAEARQGRRSIAEELQSFGLRFDLKRPRENSRQFRMRINAQERDDPRRAGPPAEPESGTWMLGPDSISAGSLHCDVWSGTGAQLAARNIICVKPVSGWWKERKNPQVCEKQARYALVVTLTAPEERIDLYTPISNIIEQGIAIQV
jgi:hypothetical protein